MQDATNVSRYKKVGENRYRETTGLYYENFNVGDVFEHRPGKTILDVDNVWFTLLTLNPQQVHFDQHYASQTEWKKTASWFNLYFGASYRNVS